MKAKTKKRINLVVIWLLVLVFAASGFLLYLPLSQGTTPAPSPSAPVSTPAP